MLDSATMKRAILVSILSSIALLVVLGQDATAQNPSELRAPSDFSSIADTPARSRALFTEPEPSRSPTHPLEGGSADSG